MKKVEIDIRGKKLILETGKYARQADGSVVGPRNNVTIWSNQKRPHRHFALARTLLRLRQSLAHVGFVPLHFISHRAHRALREL